MAAASNRIVILNKLNVSIARTERKLESNSARMRLAIVEYRQSLSLTTRTVNA